jgi:HTH-type transcriptional regulator/antitoxin HipB
MDPVIRTTGQIGDAIRRYRRQKNFSQLDLGSRMNARQATVSKLESGEPATQLRVLMDALAALDLELSIRPRSKASASDVEGLF